MSAPYLTLREAAAVAGISLPAIRYAAWSGRLRTELRVSAVLTYRVTTLAWVHEYLDSRPEWARQQEKTP